MNLLKKLINTWQMAWNTKKCKVINIIETKNKEKVYDICMPNHHNFFAGNVLVHNCHMISMNDETRYRKLFETLYTMNPKVKIIGLTATPYRLDNGYIYGNDDKTLFDGVSYKVGYKELLDIGYLSKIITKGAIESIDVSDVKKRGGEYVESDLARAATRNNLVQSSVKEIVEYGQNRKSWLVFATGIDHSNLLREEFLKYGIDARCVNGTTHKALRDQLNDDFKKFKFKCLISVGTHTTGFNAPGVDLVALVRATLSTALFVQMVSRGSRLSPGKENCLLLDFGNNVQTHGFLDDIQPREVNKSNSKKDKDIILAKSCPNCKSMISINARECHDCGYIYPEREFQHEFTSYAGALLSTDVKPQRYKVSSMLVTLYKNYFHKEKAPVLKISYRSGLNIFDEYVTLPNDDEYERNAYAIKKGKEIIKEFGSFETTLKGALKESKYWNKPEYITVIKKGKYINVINREW